MANKKVLELTSYSSVLSTDYIVIDRPAGTGSSQLSAVAGYVLSLPITASAIKDYIVTASKLSASIVNPYGGLKVDSVSGLSVETKIHPDITTSSILGLSASNRIVGVNSATAISLTASNTNVIGNATVSTNLGVSGTGNFTGTVNAAGTINAATVLATSIGNASTAMTAATFTGTNNGPHNGPHNGTIGATTPNTGAFTTVTVSANANPVFSVTDTASAAYSNQSLQVKGGTNTVFITGNAAGGASL